MPFLRRYMSWKGVIHKYREYLPVTDNTPIVTLQEGSTPLIEAVRLSQLIDERLTIYLKLEGLNPTASFKDRGMTMAISKALEAGAKAVMCASTGNTSASAAAYSARAGLKCCILVPEGKIAMGKLSQTILMGAKVLAIKGNFDHALGIVRSITDKYPITLVNSLNPYRIEGQKTAAFEICDQLGGRAPAFQALPVGNAGNITAYWKGYKEYKSHGKIDTLPRMLGFQAAGAAPIVEGKAIENPQTIASAIRIGKPASWKSALGAKEESGGLIDAVTDEEILKAYKMIAEVEGIFVEPASAAALAGVIKLKEKGYFNPFLTKKNKRVEVVCIMTGHGLKDPQTSLSVSEWPISVEPTEEAVISQLNL